MDSSVNLQESRSSDREIYVSMYVEFSHNPKVHCFNTFFYTTLDKNGPRWVTRWTKKDYEILNNKHSSHHRTAWSDKYTTVVYDEESLTEFEWKQPLPDYVRWYLTGGEQHYMTFEERNMLPKGTWDDIEELFLASKGLLTEKVRRALENKLYQEKRKSEENALIRPQMKKQKTCDTTED
ncbi:hypothetical protein OS493_012262 [Desmophyllum pertusum]|uniref:Uncharacterized protein n=1 Tax=Desmophyllum pertusum TaxID=174260 RepID=A0A9X0D5T5_9CNID|nr:hypothetical protein OS493_012262 [Desmophyllum pertusum]